MLAEPTRYGVWEVETVLRAALPNPQYLVHFSSRADEVENIQPHRGFLYFTHSLCPLILSFQ